MLFPLLYPVILTGKEKEDHWLLKIKRTNLALYFILANATNRIGALFQVISFARSM